MVSYRYSAMRIGVLFVLLFAALFLLLGSVGAFELYYADRIYLGVKVWDVGVGGMRPDAATVVLEESLGLDVPLVIVRGPGISRGVRLADLGLRIDSWNTLVPAFALGREGPIAANLLTHLRLLAWSQSLPPVAAYDEKAARLYLETLAEEVDCPPTQASLSLDGVTPVVNPAEPGRQLDVEATLGRIAPVVARLAPGEVELAVREIPPTIVDADHARAQVEVLLDDHLTLMLADPLEDDPGPWVIPVEELASMVLVRVEDGALHAALDEATLRAFLERLAPELVREPVDARFHFIEEERELESISASREGRVLDVGASTMRIVQELATGNHHVPLVVDAVSPRYPDTAIAEEVGIIELVAEGDSYFIGSPSGRDHNIRVATAKFDGIVIPPGEVFSFNEHLGEVSAEEGYDESYVTAGEQLAIEVGGGVCQVSTTAFRAAFWGGFPIAQRRYHNNRIGYYELRGAGLGMDATVYSPQVDFQFVNDRPYPLLIETEIEDAAHRLVFRFYSTSMGWRVEKEDPEITDRAKAGPPIYQLDSSLAEGKVVKWQSAVDGLTATVVRRVLDADDTVVLQDTFVSRYAPRRAAYHYGPGFEPPESAPEDGGE